MENLFRNYIIKLLIISFFILFTSNILVAQDFNIIQNFSVSLNLNNYFWNNISVFNRLSNSLSEDSFIYTLSLNYNIYFVSKKIQCLLSFDGENLLNYIYIDFNNYSFLDNYSLFLEILQVWAKINIQEGWSIAFGRKFVNNWQECIFVNPSDMVNNQTYFGYDDDVAGKDLIEILGIIEIFGMAIDLNFITIFNEQIENIEDIPLFFNFGTIIYPFELKIKIGVQNNQKPKFASSSSVVLGDLQIYYDLLYYQDSDIIFINRNNGNYFKYIIGTKYDTTFPYSKFIKGINFSFEYYHRDDGLTKAEANNLFLYISNLNLSDPDSLNEYLNVLSSYKFFIFYKNYFFSSISFYKIFCDYLNLNFLLYFNLEDNSFLYIINILLSFINFFNINISYISFHGDSQSEVIQIPYKSRIYLSFSISI